MTVRLRPRQVLCSKCKGICNENSENVSRKRKTSESVHPNPPVKRGLNAPITRSVSIHTELTNKKKLGEATLVPRLTRLTPQEEMTALNGGSVKVCTSDSKSPFKKPLAAVSVNKENTQEEKKHSSDHSEDSSNSDDVQSEALCNASKSAKRILRKKRSVGSMEDLWDESVFEENANKNNNNAQTNATDDQTLNASNLSINTKTIKISYGPQGEGTVLKIPAQIENLNLKKDTEENVNVSNSEEGKSLGNKAARKALKKAKKEARRKVFLTGSSPCYLGNGSPRYTIGGSSPRYTVGSASPRHGLGNNSPRYMCTSYDLSLPRRRKHKMKHKKKHKDDKDRKHKEGEVSSTQEDPKEQCITQKLSINLKRLNNTYASFPAPSEKTAEENTSSSDEHSEQVPDFPPPTPPIMLRINSQTLSSAPTADGGRMLVGDVVWGKIHGFPWWPGKVLTITNCGGQGPQAHVAWYGSSTSSLMQCDQLSPYLENFKIRYNKKKRGPYKEAIKQATLEAKENAQVKMRQPLGNSPSHNIIPQVVPPALASPREIDVVS
ncbi:PWWP domain-containing protein 2A-like isoform X2 [Zophobas morio]